MKQKLRTDRRPRGAGKGRKFIFLSFLFFWSAGMAPAQRFDAGFTFGAIASQVSGDMLGGYDKAGFEAGGLVSTAISEKFDLSFQIKYIQKGSRKNVNLEIGDASYYRMRLAYIEVPLQLQYKFNRKFRFEGGMAIGILMSSHEEDESGDITGIYARKEFSPLEWSILGSLNYMLWDNFFLVLGVENSVLPIRGVEQGAFRLNRDQYNSLVRFSVLYIFNSDSTQ
jgi:hypothetical protein